MRLNPEVIEKAFLSLKTGRTVRLFVDGDFKDVATLKCLWTFAKRGRILRFTVIRKVGLNS